MNQKESDGRSKVLEWENVSELYADYLKRYRTSFRRMRARFNIKPSVGLASFSGHHLDAPAYAIYAKTLKGKLHIAQFIDDEMGDSELSLRPLTKFQRKQLIVAPKPRVRPTNLISLGIPKIQYETSSELVTGIMGQETVIIGLLAHELAHCVINLPISVIQKINEACHNHRPPNEDSLYQASTDLVACHFGFAHEVLAALSAWQRVVKATTPYDLTKLAEFEYRKRVVQDWI